MVHQTQKVKNATCDWFWADGSHMWLSESKASNSNSTSSWWNSD